MDWATQPQEGLFGPDAVIWRVFREQALTLFAGGRALLLQVGHPLVAAGVQQHSNYRADPWGRLSRTLDILLSIIFGDSQKAELTARRLSERHRPVVGTDAHGRAYRALDPELMLWVHATLIETALVIYERYIGVLDHHERERYYAESMLLGEAFGIPLELLPPDLASFESYFERMLDGALEDTDTLHGVTETIFSPPAPELLGRLIPAPLWKLALLPASQLIRIATIGNAPPQLQRLLGLRLTAREQLALRAQQQVARRLVPRLPAAVRFTPYARAARARRRDRAPGRLASAAAA